MENLNNNNNNVVGWDAITAVGKNIPRTTNLYNKANINVKWKLDEDPN